MGKQDENDAPEELIWVAGRSKARAKALLAAAKQAGFEPAAVVPQSGGYYIPKSAFDLYKDPTPDDVAEPIVDDEALRIAEKAVADAERAEQEAAEKAEATRLEEEAAQAKAEEERQALADAQAKADADAQAAAAAEAQRVADEAKAAEDAAQAKFDEEKAALDGVDPLPEPKGNGSLADWIAFSEQRAKIAGDTFDRETAENDGRAALIEKYGTKA